MPCLSLRVCVRARVDLYMCVRVGHVWQIDDAPSLHSSLPLSLPASLPPCLPLPPSLPPSVVYRAYVFVCHGLVLYNLLHLQQLVAQGVYMYYVHMYVTYIYMFIYIFISHVYVYIYIYIYIYMQFVAPPWYREKGHLEHK